VPGGVTFSATMAEVVMVRWPQERAKASRLADAGIALLYLVTGDDDPPPIASCLADWVRIPGDERDLDARLAALERRATAHQAPPHVDAAGCLHYRGAVVHLLPHEARLAAVLCDRFGEDVADEALRDEGEVTAGEAARTLRTEMTRLRTRLRPVGLSVHRIRGCGYRLQSR
jgi:DNA-binding response OmpR family regulator